MRASKVMSVKSAVQLAASRAAQCAMEASAQLAEEGLVPEDGSTEELARALAEVQIKIVAAHGLVDVIDLEQQAADLAVQQLRDQADPRSGFRLVAPGSPPTRDLRKTWGSSAAWNDQNEPSHGAPSRLVEAKRLIDQGRLGDARVVLQTFLASEERIVTDAKRLLSQTEEFSRKS